MKTRIVVICMVVLSLVVFIPQASACSCAEPNIEDDFALEDNVIFSGTVMEIKEQQRTFLVTFEIDQSWKGIPDDVTTINTLTSQSSASCGYNFLEQQSYLVVAYGNWDQTPEVGICSSTTNLDFAHEQISFLNKQPLDDFERGPSFVDSVIVPSPDFDIETAFEVTTPDDCHGESKFGGAWQWIDEECILPNPPPDYKIMPHKYIFAAPLKQIKAGVALVDIQCNDGKNVVYKRDRMRAACVTLETEGKLIFERGWAAMRLGLPATDDYGRDLCSWYGGEWDKLPRLCHGLKYPLLCSMSGGDINNGTCFIPSITGVTPILEK